MRSLSSWSADASSTITEEEQLPICHSRASVCNVSVSCDHKSYPRLHKGRSKNRRCTQKLTHKGTINEPLVTVACTAGRTRTAAITMPVSVEYHCGCGRLHQLQDLYYCQGCQKLDCSFCINEVCVEELGILLNDH